MPEDRQKVREQKTEILAELQRMKERVDGTQVRRPVDLWTQKSHALTPYSLAYSLVNFSCAHTPYSNIFILLKTGLGDNSHSRAETAVPANPLSVIELANLVCPTEVQSSS